MFVGRDNVFLLWTRQLPLNAHHHHIKTAAYSHEALLDLPIEPGWTQ